MATKEQGISYDTKTLIVVLSLFIVYPAGVLLMYLWMKWKLWIKLLISAPLLLIPLAFFGIILTAMLVAVNPRAQMEKGQCVAVCNERFTVADERSSCIQSCSRGPLPAPSDSINDFPIDTPTE